MHVHVPPTSMCHENNFGELVLSTMWIQGPNSGLQTWEQGRLPTEPSHCPHGLTCKRFFQLNGLL